MKGIVGAYAPPGTEKSRVGIGKTAIRNSVHASTCRLHEESDVLLAYGYVGEL